MNTTTRLFIIFGFLLFTFNNVLAQTCAAAFTVSETDLTIQFTDQSTSAGGDPIVSWFWDFDDNGATSTQQNPIHTFSEPDKFDVELFITTASGCMADIKIRIEICVLPLNVTVGSCDANGNILLTINVTDVYDNADEIDIAIDGNLIPGSPFEIDASNPVNTTATIIGDGLQHVLTVQSTDIGTCNNSFTFTVPDCNSNCFLSAMQIGFAGGTTHVVNVGTGGNNVFTPNQTSITVGDVVDFTFVDNGHTTTSDATTGPDAWNSGELGVGLVYPVTIQNPGVHPYYCIPHGGPNGAGMAGTIIANCPAGNNFTLEINFNTTQANPLGYNILVDGLTQAGSPFSYNGTDPQTANIPLSGDGQAHTIEVIDVNDPTCVLSTNFTAPDCGAAPTCSLSLNANQTGGCNAANNVNVEVTVTSINGGAAGFNLTVDGATVTGSPFNYAPSGTTILNIEVTGDGQNHNIVATDVNDTACTASTSVTTANCTIPCSLTNLTAMTGANSTHVVFAEDFVFNPANITISAGDIIEWQWTGAIDHTSTSDATSGADSWDSGLLGTNATYQSPVLSAGVHPYYCIPHGAPGGTGMAGTITVQANCTNGEVAVSLNFNESGGGFSGYNILVDGQITPNSPIAYDPSGTNSASVFVLGDGQNHTIQIQDVDDSTCSVTTNITTPNCNAPTCQLTASAVENGGCDPNDNVPVDVTVNDVGGGSGFSILVDGQNAGSFSYSGNGTTIVTINISGDGNSHNIEVIDNDEPTCTATTSVTTTNCIIPCILSNLNASTGSSATHIVGVEDFVFNPAHITITTGDIVEWQWTGAIDHTSTSDASTGADSWDSGLLGTGATYQSPVLSAGVHPYYCIPHGAPGGVGMAGTITVQANCTNGMVSVNLTFNSQGGSFTGFDVLVDGVFNSNHNYDPSGTNSISILVNGDGNSHSIEIVDTDDPNCSISTNITTPDCNAPTCQLTASATENGGCDPNDNVPVDVTVTDVGGGSGFSILVDGQNAGSFSYSGNGTTVVTINISGDGNSHSIEVIDNDEPNCTATTSVTTTNCVIPCILSNLNASTGSSATHIVGVEDFVFNPAHITITAGDIVEWQWTGAIDHTSTSDAPSGADSWDSGLLGTGATYQSPVLSAGVHPYYCIPHGAPGGVGMAGTITVQANCTNGEVSINLTFNSQGGSFTGFDVLVDGVFNSNHNYDPSGTNSISILVNGDGNSHSIEIVDTDDPNCSISTNITTPDCNAPTCQLTASALENGGCDPNDNVPVDVTVNDVGGGSGFSILVDGQNAGSFSYSGNGTTIVTINVSGDANSHSIEVIDNDEPTCTATTSVTTTNCIIPCILSNLNASTGSSATHIVGVEDFVFNPAHITITAGDIVEWQWTGAIDHTSTSDATTGADSWDSGLLGTNATYQSPVLSAGVHPYYCIPHGAPGGVGMAGTITVQANCTNGMVSVNLTFNSQGGSFTGFDVLVDGSFNSNHNYDPSGTNSISILVNGDGNSHSIEIVDNDDPNCTISTNITTPNCNAPTCQLTASAVENGGCDPNDNVPVDVTVNDVGGGSGFSILVDGQNVGSFSYSGNGTTVVTIDVLGDGNLHNIEVIDNDEPTCTVTTSVTTTNCIIPCILSNLSASTGNPVTETVLVQDFDFEPKHLTIREGDIVDFQWTGAIDHTTTSDATTGNDIWDSGLLGTGANFQVTDLSLGLHPYYCIPHGAPGGVGMAGTITVVPDCDANNQVAVNLTFTSQGGSFNGFNILVDGNSVGNFNYDPTGSNSVTINVDGDGQNHIIEIQDFDEPNCSISTNITTPDCNFTPPCEITVSANQIGTCDPDGNVDVELTVTDLNAAGSDFFYWIDGMPYGTNPYSGTGTTTLTIPMIGDGQSHTIIVSDFDNSINSECTDTTMIITQNCQAQCEFSNLNASTGSPATHVVEVRDFDFFPENITINEGDNINFQWAGAIDHTTTSDATSGNDVWDSGLLGTGASFQVSDLSLGNHPYYCIPHGSPGGIGMAGEILVVPNCLNGEVAVTLSFISVDGGLNGFNVFIDGNLTPNSPMNYNSTAFHEVTVFAIGDGQIHTFEIQDVDNPDCNISIDFQTPDCSFGPPCELSLGAAQIGDCNENDEVEIQLTVQESFAGSAFNLSIDGNLYNQNPIAYDPSGTTVVTLTLNGDGQNHLFEIQDIDSTNCIATENFVVDDCVTPCQFSNLILNTIGGGIPATHLVEVQDFEFSPKDITITAGDQINFQWTGNIPHTATSDSPTQPDAFDSGLLNNGDNFMVTINSEGLHPYYCIPHGAPGGVGMAGTITATPPPPPCNANGEVSVNVSFEAVGNGTTGYLVFLDGNQIGDVQTYTGGVNSTVLLVAGDGESHNIEIQDADDSNCVISNSIITQNCTPPMPCELSLSAMQISDCDSNDSINVELTILSQNTGTSGFNIFVEGNLLTGSPFNYDNSDTTILNINLDGNGMTQSIEIQDIDSTNCSSIFQIETPNCFQFCQITNLEINENTANKHFVEVKEFEFVPALIDVLVGDTVEFFWTGVIPHTSTSDAISGANAWDSGLLNQGDTLQVVITEAGAHPYYCIPHGGPNGIGQSGVINALEPCQDSTAFLTLNFEANLGSNEGYQIFLDGTQIAGPLNYDNPNGSNSTIISVPADGEIHLLTVQDLATSFCAATLQFTAPDCEILECDIFNLSVEFSEPMAHIVEVQDFEFSPKDITINLGDTVRFVWTGVIPHTSTSDAISGDDVWESGLLGEGEIFDLVIQNEGFHPYYCIPHGEAGGIGMAGTITVIDENCQNGLVTANVSFEHQATSEQGFNIFINGALTADSPLEYASDFNTFSVHLLGDGNEHSIVVADVQDAFCADTISIITENCNQNCSLLTSFEQIGDCNENDEIPFEITIQNENSSDSFNLIINGNLVQTVNYDSTGTTILPLNLLGNGSTYEIIIQDSDSLNCQSIFSINTDDCSPPCQLDMTINQLDGCDGNEEIPYELTINATNFGGEGFQLFIDNQPFPTNPIQYDGATTSINITLAGDGQMHEIIAADLEFPECADTLEITTPTCGAMCDLSNLEINFNSPQVHEVAVLDFDFEPKDITVNIGDTVRFVWIGQIPHTATSDATTGDDVFNSGLLGEGSVFDVVIQNAGFHPYYCIPHGSPGGIGMAGSITAVEDCDDGNLNMQFSFDMENGGFSGYEVFIDGNFENSFDYQNENPQSFELTLPADGQTINLMIQDADDNSCLIDTTFQMPSCSDPCFGFEANFDIEFDHNNLSIILTDLTENAVEWLWTFGDGDASFLQNPNHTYEENGIYEVCLTATNADGCEDQICQSIEIGQYLCEANFSYEIDGLTVTLTDQSITTDSITQWTYDMGNMNWIVGQQNPTYTYDTLGIYTICLYIEAGACEADTCFALDLSDECLAFQPAFDFVVDNDNLTVQFIDQTTGDPNQWLWGFGDTNTSNDQNPEHTYNQMGNYNVCLLVQNTVLGCNESICEVVQVGTVSTIDLDIRNFDLKIYPNPASKENLTWTLEGILERDFYQNLELKMYDVQGRTLVQQRVLGAKEVVFSVENGLASGVYFVEMRSEFGVYRGRVLVE